MCVCKGKDKKVVAMADIFCLAVLQFANLRVMRHVLAVRQWSSCFVLLNLLVLGQGCSLSVSVSRDGCLVAGHYLHMVG